MTERVFPIQAQRGYTQPYPLQVPWSIAELAYSSYVSQYGRVQTLERLAERGGFGPGEMDAFLPDWRARCNTIVILQEERDKLAQLLAEAAQEINCAGPVAHRIRVLKREHAERLERALQEKDDEWIERANRYFEGVRDPRKQLGHWAQGSVVADVVMHEVWKRDPKVEALTKPAQSLLAVVFYNDNGNCSICHGYWPNEHREHCQGAKLKKAIEDAP